MRILSLIQRAPDALNGGLCLISLITLLLTGPAHAQLAAPNAAGVTFAHVHLSVADAEPHKKIWIDLFHAVPADKEGYAVVRVPGALIFFTEQAPTAPSTDTAVDHVGLTVRDLEATLGAWRALGHDAEEEFSEVTGAAQAYITLPDGVRLELVEDPTLPTKAAMNHVHFFTPQPHALRAWYVDLLGAVPQPGRATEPAAHVPGSRLFFQGTEGVRAPTDDTAIDHVGFEVEHFEAFLKRLQDKGVEFVFGPRYIERLELWVVFFVDPSGALIEVSAGLDTW